MLWFNRLNVFQLLLLLFLTGLVHKNSESFVLDVNSGPGCEDTNDRCNELVQASCDSFPSARKFCPKTCRVCRNCTDTLDCSVYSSSVCTTNRGWAVENCPKFCKFCGGCTDVFECYKIGRNVCTAFQTFSQQDCRKYCGYCSDIFIPEPFLTDLTNLSMEPPTPSITTHHPTTIAAVSTTTDVQTVNSVCNKFELIIAAAKGIIMTDPMAGYCSDRVKSQSEAIILKTCAAPDPVQWTQGKNVMTNCDSIAPYTPIATFTFGSYPRDANGMSGVLIACEPHGFQAIFQVCGNPPKIVHLTEGNGQSYISDANNFYTVNWVNT